MEYFEPDLPNPYPAAWLGRGECADFEMTVVVVEYHTPLILYRDIESVRQRTDSDAEYVVGADYKVSFRLDVIDKEDFDEDDPFAEEGDGVSRDEFDVPVDRFEITVPKGMLTDLTSVPPAVRGIIGPVGPHLEAAIVHDFLYVAWQDVAGVEAREKDREFADKLMRAAMLSAGGGSFQRRAIYDAVAEFGRNPYRYVKIP